ncbi:hypothetical protein BGX27_007820 [Mortierella sp. AM989]|nr:hypothetical protein BGX27_007820 [Mortierella sp. AM989]
MNFSIFATSKKHISQKNKHPLTTNNPALHLPEILSIIFSFLNQYTLKSSVRFVCKQWHAVATTKIHLQALWKDRTHLKYSHRFLLNRLHLVTHLRVFFEQQWPLNNTQYAWRELEETIDSLRDNSQLHISKLILNGAKFMESRIYTILPKITTLTELHIERTVQRNIHLGVILAVCPTLRRLYIEYPENFHLIQDNTTPPWLGTESGLRDSRIESVIINGMHVEQDSLEAIIGRCSYLRVLKLAGVLQESPDPFDRVRLYRKVMSSCPRLECFHFSIQGEYMDQGDSKELINAFFPGVQTPENSLTGADNDKRRQAPEPLLSILSIADADIRSENAQHLFLPFKDPFFNNVLTTLELEPAIGTNHHHVGYILHSFLCTAPALLHFSAPTIPFEAEYLDLASTIPGDEGYYSPRNCRTGQPISENVRIKKKMWVCRKLQTLKVQFKSMISDSANPENARIMFGYIARTCPELRILSIHRVDLDLRLDGGLCLLTRLKRLEKLMVQTGTKTLLKVKDLEWMTRYPKKSIMPWINNSHTNTVTNPGTASSPTSSIVSSLSNVSISRNNSTRSRSSNGSSIYEGGYRVEPPRELIFDDFAELGSITEVKECRRQLAQFQDDQGCWPHLEFLGIQVGMFRNTKGENVKDNNLPTIIESVRPNIEFSTDANSW